MKLNNKIGFVETPIDIARLMVELSEVNKNEKVLDTGCGKGIFLQALKEKGYNNVVGIEIERELYNYCKKKFRNTFHIILGDFLTYDFKEKFTLIIGNPPYIHFNQLPSDVASKVKEIIKTSEGDIYYAFIIKSISLLKENGELIYIVPYHFFYNTYAKLVRETILKFGKIEIIIDLDEVRLFNGVNPETIIFKFKKGNFNLREEKIKVLRIKTRKTTSYEIYKMAIRALKSRTSNQLFEYYELGHYLTSETWSSFNFNITEFPYLKLKDIAKIGVGLVSGFDKAFIVSPTEIEFFKNNEKGLIKYFIKAKHCKRFLTKEFDLYVVLDESIKNEDELRTKYPNVYKKILPFKNEMAKRYIPGNKKWFHWQALRNYKFLLSNLNKKRIYVPTMDRHPYNRFSLGEENLLPSGDVLFIRPYNDNDLYFLLGYLNSSFFRKYYLLKGGRKGGRVVFTQRLLENIEIPLFSEDVKEEITQITKEITFGGDTKILEDRLDKLIDWALHNSLFKPTLKYWRLQ